MTLRLHILLFCTYVLYSIAEWRFYCLQYCARCVCVCVSRRFYFFLFVLGLCGKVYVVMVQYCVSTSLLNSTCDCFTSIMAAFDWPYHSPLVPSTVPPLM